MSNRTGSGCGGWFLAIVAMAAAFAALTISGGVAVESVAEGADIGGLLEIHDLSGLLAVVALIALGMARRRGT